MTTWGAQAPPNAATPAALWSPLDDSFPPTLDGGDASTLVWLGTYDGGGAAQATTEVAIGTAPQRTAWDAPAQRSTAWTPLGAPT